MYLYPKRKIKKGSSNMRKVYLYGGYWNNDGPSNVNQAYVQNADSRFYYQSQSKFGIVRKLHTLVNFVRSDVIIISNVLSRSVLQLMKILHKKMLYLMHGNVAYETIANKSENAGEATEREKEYLDYATRIICVSEKYAAWVASRYPEYRNKITFVNNGVNIAPREKKKKQEDTIAVTGGNRSIKNNKVVCEAVHRANLAGGHYKISVFGSYYPNNEEIFDFPEITYLGQLSKDEYYRYLDEISLVVMNSDVESFGLVVEDALNCHCSLLLSDSVGAGAIMQQEESDLIHNTRDENEILEKIQYLLQNPNSERLLKSIDLEAVSAKQAFANLRKLCEEV